VADLGRLEAWGVLEHSQDNTYQIRSRVVLWWLLEQLGPLVRRDITLRGWLQGQGLSMVSRSAIQHFAWRLKRLQGKLSRGARPMIMFESSS